MCIAEYREYESLISVIIPIFNQEQSMEQCFRSLKKQTIPFENLEIILINDGSEDASGTIGREISSQYTNVLYLEQENQGVSAARNQGLRHANGKYIFYLDADDKLAPDTIEKVSEFFDTVYDETDLVTYPLDTIVNNRVLEPHFRYEFLTESGLYDLREYPYIGQTTMNIVIKNRFSENIMFDETQNFSEDQRYCCEVLMRTLKMGFCRDGRYLYYRSAGSSSGRLSGSCFIFEQCINFFEELFSKYPETVPVAFQGLYVNDIYWKLLSNILFPYHYEKSEYQQAVERISNLLKRCENRIIWEHPKMDFFEKYYFLRLKDPNNLQCRVNQQEFCLYDGKILLVRENSMEMVLTKIRIYGSHVEICGFLKSVFFQFYDRKPTLCVVENQGKVIRKLQLFTSTHNYYLSHEKTQCFWAMRYEFDARKIQEFSFQVEVNDFWFPVHYYFMPLVPFSHTEKIYEYQCENIRLKISSQNHFLIEEKCVAKKTRPIWLYYDCAGVVCDNGLLQFLHDIDIEDGIERFYVVSDKRQYHKLNGKKNTVIFGTKKHKALFLKAEKIVTAYIEESNVIPFASDEYEKIANQLKFEVVYLQHGVLHIVMPWKYSHEKLLADRVVVSTVEEAKLYQKSGFKDSELIRTGMPRLGILQRVQKTNKILYAPSWRQYLVGTYTDHKWESLENKFLSSSFFQSVSIFLNLPELSDYLEANDQYLEIRLHPIFKMYEHLLHWKSERIRFAPEQIVDGEYIVFITDYSSYAYNFSFLKIPVIHYIPDWKEFKCGMNGYRELNYSELFWKHVAENGIQVVERLKQIASGQWQDSQKVTFYKSQNICEDIYRAMKDGAHLV